MIMMRRYVLGVLLVAVVALSTQSSAQESQQDLCRVMGVIETLINADGPLKHCRDGDVAHFQIDQTRVSPAIVASRYCDFAASIFTDTLPGNNIAHLVCRYKWKWAKDVERTRHPNSQ